MKFRRYTMLILLVYFISAHQYSIVQSQTIGSVNVFEPEIGYSFTAVASATLLWEEGKSEIVTLSIVGTTPTNISKIHLEIISFDIWGDVAGQDAQIPGGVSLFPSFGLSISNSTYFVNVTIEPPAEVDSFYFNIEIFAKTSGTKVSERATYTVRFPDEGTILISRDKLAQLVQLYGFPPTSFFRAWFPFYVSILFLFSLPSLVMGGVKVKRWTGKGSENPDKSIVEDDSNE